MIGTTVSHYRITGTLGQGGMGDVYVAFDETLARKVALKAIRPDRRLSLDARARFLREARVLSQLDHPRICRVFDYVSGEDA
ncbi:MAG TPA: protein kinase, partial [Vicinamibacteria bacterium]